MQTLYGPIETRFFATHYVDPYTLSGVASVSALVITNPTHVHYADYAPDPCYEHIIPDNYVEVFGPLPGAAWWLYDIATQTWTERDYPEDWNGLKVGETE